MKNKLAIYFFAGVILSNGLSADYGQSDSTNSPNAGQKAYSRQDPTNYSQQGQTNYNQTPQSTVRYNSQGVVTNNQSTANDNKYPNEKKYPKDQFNTESDRAVNNRIRQQVASSFKGDFNTITFRTSEGIVVIDGIIRNADEQKQLMASIEQINGVKHVVNNTKVKK